MGPDRYESRDLEIDFRQLRAMRREVIRSTAETFRPHVFMVDNVPLGMKGEIVPTLEMIRRRIPHTKVVLNLRDILDDAETIKKAWSEHDVPGALDRFYDGIYVLGDETVYDAVSQYGLPPGRTQLVGYATPGARLPAAVRDQSTPLSHPQPGIAGNGAMPSGGGPPRVIVTAGGGGDGYELLAATLQGAARLDGRPVDLHAVTGPLMDAGARRSLLRMAESSGGTVHEFVGDLPRRMAEADLVVAMAGYNTCCEVLSHARSVLLYPRTVPRLEQKLRADAFARLGLASVLPTGEPTPEAMAAAVTHALTQGASLESAVLPRLEGQRRIAWDLARLVPGLLDDREAHEKARPGDGWSSLMRAIPEVPRSLASLRDAWISEIPMTESTVNFWPGSVLRS
jgi:predicted glycosyltransferase